MLYPCADYYTHVPHAPHDWKVYDEVDVECPGRFDDGGSAGMLVEPVPDLPDTPGAMRLTPLEEHLELERSAGRPLAVA